jgi:NitT/TauT family transport system permease protein
VALANGSGDLRDDSDWLQAGPFAALGRELNAMDQVIGVMLVIVAIGLLADKIVFAPWERFLHRRWGTGRA